MTMISLKCHVRNKFFPIRWSLSVEVFLCAYITTALLPHQLFTYTPLIRFKRKLAFILQAQQKIAKVDNIFTLANKIITFCVN